MFVFGIILLVIGGIFSLYQEGETYNVFGFNFSVSHGYAYQFIGIALVLIGIIFTLYGFFYFPLKTLPVEE